VANDQTRFRTVGDLLVVGGDGEVDDERIGGRDDFHAATAGAVALNDTLVAEDIEVCRQVERVGLWGCRRSRQRERQQEQGDRQVFHDASLDERRRDYRQSAI